MKTKSLAFRGYNNDKCYIIQRGKTYDFYAITERRKNDTTEKGKHRVKGLNSPFGRRGSVCAHLGWTWDYLHHSIAWGIVQRLLIDAPSVESDDDDSAGGKAVKLTKENAGEVLSMIKNISR